MNRPRGVTAVALALAILNVLSLAFSFAVTDSGTGTRIYLVAFALIAWAVLWFFWQGRNWARILILIQSGFALINALVPNVMSHEQYLAMIAQAAVAIFLLIWLNRPEIRAWYHRRRDD